MTDYRDTYIEINNQFKEIITQSLTDAGNYKKHAEIASFFDDYKRFIGLCKNEEIEVIFNEANAEYRTMLLFYCMGLYKNAYMSLRGYFELTLFGILISTSDFAFRKWKNDKKDVRWCEITGEDGIFSTDFVEIYNNKLVSYSEEMKEDAKHLYRTCSEYIHSGYQVSVLDEKTVFNQEIFDQIYTNVKSINRIISYAFSVRYGEKMLKSENKDYYASIIDEYLPEINKELV